MGRDSAVRLDGVGRRYGMGGPWVLRGVDLAVRAGTLVRVEGGNGTGKSTLLRLLAGIDAPSEGRVSGRPRTAFVPERFPAALPFTANGYLTHMGRVHGLSKDAAARRATEWLERFGAGEYGRTQLSELSKGSSQKVAVAQALLAEADLLVLDEAWTGLDASARAELDRAVAERAAAGGSVVFVDHDPRRLLGAADETYAVVGTALNRVTRHGTSEKRPYAGPTVVVEARGPHGAQLPSAVVELMTGAGVPVDRRAPDGITRITVPEPRSDLVLRELLTARPPWHVVTVTSAGPGAGPDGTPRPTAASAHQEATASPRQEGQAPA
ncbi:ATP-binding cassette domain-containing protein [Streptomyces luteocolor]|uniref:ATP-binding cassette domain-containing protein n=1 Tax=Streptomyces luteocolor TaxID=285500 RepID=UPI000852DB58|nr:ABC transporter ATP-binding protein [Streptomyces luteocolor]